MSDTIMTSPGSSLPQQTQASTAAAQQHYPSEHVGSSGHASMSAASQSHGGPPALAPVIIPQNNNPIPTAITSPMSGNGMILSPTSSGGFVRRSAPEPNKRALYVGGLDPRVTEEVLRQIFETTGHVQNVKIIPDKNVGASKGFNYGFIEYDDPGAAERAMQTLNGRRVHQAEIRVNWAYQSNASNKEDTSNHYHIFVGDLSNEVNDEVLLQAFSAFGSVSEARVMWDMKTGRSRGYGFVAYRDRIEAEKALSSMDGEWLGSRAIRCNWANQKGQPSISQHVQMAQVGMTPTTTFGHHHFPTHGVQSYDMIVQQTPQWQTTCYIGNLTPYTTQNDLIPLFQTFGYVVETRFQADRGFAFVKMDTHENAAMAICQLSGCNVNGRPLKCSWGKDRPPTGQVEAFSPQTAQTPGFAQTAASFFPQYGGPGGHGGPAGPSVSAMTPHSGAPTGNAHFSGQPPNPQSAGGHNPGAQRWGQGQSGFGVPSMGQAGYGSMQPASAGGYGRGNQNAGPQWNQHQHSAGGFGNVGNGFGGYQG